MFEYILKKKKYILDLSAISCEIFKVVEHSTSARFQGNFNARPFEIGLFLEMTPIFS